ncbi:MAG: PepSY-like domain-containing protein [Candidatus Hydrogenedentes bacterium]|nr:PepSY-like domain-containing protein [Candidatus Hydrogenedentota bacterium]
MLMLGLVLPVAIAIAFAAEEKVEMKDLPAAVQKTLAAEAGSAPVLEIEQETEDGKIVYEAEVKKEEGIVEVEIAEDGTLLKAEAGEDEDEEGEQNEEGEDEDGEEGEKGAAASDLPEAVQNRIKSDYADKTCTFSIEKEDGNVYYEAEYEENDTAHSIKMTEGGDVIESEVEAKTLPEAVAAHIKKAHPKAEIVESESVQLNFYEVELKTGGKTREIKVLANGQELDED